MNPETRRYSWWIPTCNTCGYWNEPSQAARCRTCNNPVVCEHTMVYRNGQYIQSERCACRDEA